MDRFSAAAVGGAYDAVADEYDATFGDDLASLALDRQVLDDAFADGATGRDEASRPVLDLGCGPGPVAQHLAGLGRAVVGVDLAPGMLRRARRRVPGAGWAVADARALPFRSGSLGGVVAYYSLQHLARAELAPALVEARRVLVRDGVLVVALHLGEGEVEVDELLGRRVPPMGGTFYAPDELRAAVTSAGFAITAERRRQALDHEHPSERIYLTARCD